LDPAWATVLIAAEGAGLTHVTMCLRAPGRYAAREGEVQQSVEDGYSNTLTPKLSAVIQRVDEVRRPERQTAEGKVPAEPVSDVLASSDLYDECEELTSSLASVVDARTWRRRCVALHVARGVALIFVLLLVPIALWHPLTDTDLVEGTLRHVLNTVLATAAISAVVLLVLAILADNAFDKALVRHRPRHERIG
jgi:hypothetical protein